jgi:hypothetical protein
LPLPTIAGTVRCSYRGLAPSGRQWVNVVHCRYATGASSPGSTEITALDAKLVRLWSGTAYSTGTAWLAQCLNNVTLIDATYYVLNGTAAPVVINHAATGTVAGTPTHPSEVAHVLTLRTGTRGRRYRGRIYLPTAGGNAISAGNLTSTAATAIVAQMAGLQTDLATIQWEIGVASYGSSYNRGPHNANGAAAHVTWTPFFTALQAPGGATMDLKPDVQRRRK